MNLKDKLLGALIGIARATDGSEHLICESATAFLQEALAATASEAAQETLERLIHAAEEVKRSMVPNCFLCACPCGRTSDFPMKDLEKECEPVRSMKYQLLSGIQQLAVRGIRSGAAGGFYYKALIVIGMEGFEESRMLVLLRELANLG